MRRRWFWIACAVVTLLIAGAVSYGASASPDGLDAATLRGCQTVHTAGGDALTGQCIAQHVQDHGLAASPLAGYTVGGHPATSGLAGVLGVLVTIVVAGAVFWLIGRSRRRT